MCACILADTACFDQLIFEVYACRISSILQAFEYIYIQSYIYIFIYIDTQKPAVGWIKF